MSLYITIDPALAKTGVCWKCEHCNVLAFAALHTEKTDTTIIGTYKRAQTMVSLLIDHLTNVVEAHSVCKDRTITILTEIPPVHGNWSPGLFLLYGIMMEELTGHIIKNALEHCGYSQAELLNVSPRTIRSLLGEKQGVLDLLGVEDQKAVKKLSPYLKKASKLTASRFLDSLGILNINLTDDESDAIMLMTLFHKENEYVREKIGDERTKKIKILRVV